MALLQLVRPTARGGRPSTVTCFGGGGAFGIAFNLGVARALQDGGMALEDGPMLGTSAGSWTAAALATGMTLEDLVPTWERPGDPGPRRVIDSSGALWGDRRDARVVGIALQMPLGRRRLLSGAEHPIADVVAASSSLPGFAASHVIDGRRYVDGGLVSPASADRAPAADVLVVTAPMGGPLLGTVGRLIDQRTRWETAHWSVRHGRPVLYVHPDQRFRANLRRLGDVMAMRGIEEVHRKAYELGCESLEAFHSRGRQPAGWAAWAS